MLALSSCDRGELSGDGGRSGGVIDDDRPRCETGQDAVGAEDDRAKVVVVADELNIISARAAASRGVPARGPGSAHTNPQLGPASD